MTWGKWPKGKGQREQEWMGRNSNHSASLTGGKKRERSLVQGEAQSALQLHQPEASIQQSLRQNYLFEEFGIEPERLSFGLSYPHHVYFGLERSAGELGPSVNTVAGTEGAAAAGCWLLLASSSLSQRQLRAASQSFVFCRLAEISRLIYFYLPCFIISQFFYSMFHIFDQI